VNRTSIYVLEDTRVVPMPSLPVENFTLSDRYELESGTVLISGIQALVRALSTRAQLDTMRGLDTGGFVSGYRGSPLGGLDKELWAQGAQLKKNRVHFQPGINEDLAATAVWGSQQVGLHQGNTVNGVFGLWYGKAPGLDRSCDAIRHANAWGTSKQGGVLLVVGDDPAAKSSSLATQSEFTLQDMMIPILAPACVQDVLDYAVLGWEMSRASGVWVGLKAIADHMDSSAVIEVGLDRYPQALPSDADLFIRTHDTPVAQESRILHEKLPQALAYARKSNINKWLTPRSKTPSRLGIVCAGKAYSDVRQAFDLLGLESLEEIAEAGVQLLKLGMTWPLDGELAVEFAEGVETVLVVEEKRAFVETQLKEALYGQSQTPIVGKRDLQGGRLVKDTGILEPADLAVILVDWVAVQDNKCNEIAGAVLKARTAAGHAPAKTERTPLFCAGCPHNTSTRVPEGSRATAGIGCHYMVQWMQRRTDSCSHMGGEGIGWVGEAPFTKEPHIFANLGDGTYFHSGILAIRQAVAAKVNITYKILFNDAVAMTGGQAPDGELDVRRVIDQVTAEGVATVVVVSDEPKQHRRLGVEVFHRRELDDVQKSLAATPGTTVLIYQQTCATELRRQRKRGLVPDEKPNVMINEAVCEGCGDCSVKSNCVAVEPVVTAAGVKRKINQTACNKDLSCADGFCPAFVEVKVEEALQPTAHVAISAEPLPAPKTQKRSANVLITGVGGTGIVTLSALLAVAGKIEGKTVKTLDMTGLAQKGGAVFSHVRISDQPIHTPRIPLAGVDTLVGCDLVAAASDEAVELLSANTRVVVNRQVLPTAAFILGSGVANHTHRMQRLTRVAKEVADVAADQAVEDLLGTTVQANVFVLGYAFQTGALPLQVASIHRAIELNGFAVEENLRAFEAGRLAVLESENSGTTPQPETQEKSLSLAGLMTEHRHQLLEYQNQSLADRYTDLVDQMRETENAIKPGSERLTRAVACNYVKLLMVKDEYEVARLHGSANFLRQVEKQFGPGAKISYLLAPPILGKKKRRFGPWMGVVFRCLAGLKGARNTFLDPFVYTQDRRLELRLIADFESLVSHVQVTLSLQNYPLALSLFALYEQVRGFGYVKGQAYERMQRDKASFLVEFNAPAEPVRWFNPVTDEAA
jgi:indolepyruvate ferredoxin oxidoreductase